MDEDHTKRKYVRRNKYGKDQIPNYENRRREGERKKTVRKRKWLDFEPDFQIRESETTLCRSLFVFPFK